jgi:hypothetical protein
MFLRTSPITKKYAFRWLEHQETPFYQRDPRDEDYGRLRYWIDEKFRCFTSKQLWEQRTQEWSAGPYRGGICRFWHRNTRIAYNLLRCIGEETKDSTFLNVLDTNYPSQDGRGWSFTIPLPQYMAAETDRLLRKWTRIWDEEIERTHSDVHEPLMNAGNLQEIEDILSHQQQQQKKNESLV